VRYEPHPTNAPAGIEAMERYPKRYSIPDGFPIRRYVVESWAMLFRKAPVMLTPIIENLFSFFTVTIPRTESIPPEDEIRKVGERSFPVSVEPIRILIMLTRNAALPPMV